MKRYNSKLQLTLTLFGVTSTTNYIGRIWANSQEEADATFKDMITNENGNLDWKKLEVMLEYKMAYKETV
ncbi:hypothetical protein [Burkholderia cenocepacia]|uniref:hypothetical protein n=1 Tax=Burkholderia cenocepacia TaxID=95486 RepID=UPI0009816968|nr:hypothetical protein [Burkholderia cenocepacia]AQQ43255.1 hypothetical protein A8E75_30575 [Burkholderia cenocepacia]ONV25281.1 hypothetical protein A8E74_09655 [Burkholderia cenocepacia]ONV30595.1 hypothetical protein A8E78_17470 [Burkholderia cenocepacia]ONV33444.1 hypothetical protein A8E77_15820 [Burkholderia cenocepacia]ONV40553.1 hypothetical protein A8E82_19535 [Burkholderia cenocepacia]